jgi:hypothetical protein
MLDRMARRRVVLATVLAALLGGVLAAAMACTDPSTFVYSGAPFDPVNNCLGPYQALDVVSGGNGASNCAPVCLVSSGMVFVSTVCPPFPDPTAWDTSGQNGNCPNALSAFARGDMCSPDGGSSNPWVMPMDANMPPPDAPAGDAPSGDAAACDEAGADDSGVCCDQGGACGQSDAAGVDAPVSDGPTE